MPTPSKEIVAELRALTESLRSLGNNNLGELSDAVGKARAEAIIASDQNHRGTARIKELEKEIKSLRCRVKLFDSCIECYHEALSYYSNENNWRSISDLERKTVAHAIGGGWEAAQDGMAKAERYSEALVEHLRNGTKG